MFTSTTEPAKLLETVKLRLIEFGDPNTPGVLRGADRGQDAYRHIVQELSKGVPGATLDLEFSGVKAISAPFADESICRLLTSWQGGYIDEHPLLITAADDDVRATLAALLRQRRVAALAKTPDGYLELLGGDEAQIQTVQTAEQLGGSFTASDIAEQLNLALPAANNRLRTLSRTGAVYRSRGLQRGGREFLYRLATTAAS